MEARKRRAAESREETILRFERAEILVHWGIAVPFIVCYLTAALLALVFYHFPQHPLREVTSWIHRISGVCLIVLPLTAILVGRRRLSVHLENIRQAWVWTFDDFKWLALMGLAAVSSRFELPEQGKFNAAEKLNFMMVMTTWPLYAVTGVMIWLPGIAFAAWVAHFGMALLATPLLFGHIYMAVVNPASRAGLSGMISGNVSREWAQHHYAVWFREKYGVDSAGGAGEEEGDTITQPVPIQAAPETDPSPAAVAPSLQPPPQPPRPNLAGLHALAPPTPPLRPALATMRCSACATETPIHSWDELLSESNKGESVRCATCGEDHDQLTVVLGGFEGARVADFLDRADHACGARIARSAVFLPLRGASR